MIDKLHIQEILIFESEIWFQKGAGMFLLRITKPETQDLSDHQNRRSLENFSF